MGISCQSRPKPQSHNPNKSNSNANRKKRWLPEKATCHIQSEAGLKPDQAARLGTADGLERSKHPCGDESCQDDEGNGGDHGRRYGETKEGTGELRAVGSESCNGRKESI